MPPADDLLALPVERLAVHLGSKTRASRVWRHLAEEGLPREVPERIPGITADAWNAARSGLSIPDWTVVARRTSADGTSKLAVQFGDVTVETVLIPGPHRSTVCLSSQSGCTRHCRFCATATLGFRRQLRTGEIVAQYLLAQQMAPAGRPARNVVFMGMGEPLDNLDAVLPALRILAQSPFPALSPARLTVSTSGVVPGMIRFLRESDASLALSLNATTDDVRVRLMPHTRTWPIERLLATLREHARGRIVFVEYVLFDGINDTDADSERLPGLLSGIDARVNLIPFNGFFGNDFRSPTHEHVHRFQRALARAGLRCIVRTPRGRDIDGACGQLALRLDPLEPAGNVANGGGGSEAQTPG